MNSQEKYHQTKPWMKHLIYARQRCNNPNNTGYKWYGGKGIKCLLSNNEIKFLWLRDKAYGLLQPSIDRKNSNKDYTLDNCQFIEKLQNSTKGWKFQIGQFSKDNKFIKLWDSARSAGKALNIQRTSISACLRKQPKYKTAGGFKWLFIKEK